MDNNLKNIETEIFKLKDMLYKLIRENNLTDTSVVKCSKKLDELILQYHRRQMSTSS